jgi:hypothetical protein
VSLRVVRVRVGVKDSGTRIKNSLAKSTLCARLGICVMKCTVAFKMSIDLVKDLFILRDIVDFFQEGHNLRF